MQHVMCSKSVQSWCEKWHQNQQIHVNDWNSCSTSKSVWYLGGAAGVSSVFLRQALNFQFLLMLWSIDSGFSLLSSVTCYKFIDPGLIRLRASTTVRRSADVDMKHDDDAPSKKKDRSCFQTTLPASDPWWLPGPVNPSGDLRCEFKLPLPTDNIVGLAEQVTGCAVHQQRRNSDGRGLTFRCSASVMPSSPVLVPGFLSLPPPSSSPSPSLIGRLFEPPHRQPPPPPLPMETSTLVNSLTRERLVFTPFWGGKQFAAKSVHLC